MKDDDETREFTVVFNHEEQYALWPANKEVPAGWRNSGRRGSRAECLAYVEEVWVDMRPRSLREAMNAAGEADPKTPPGTGS